MKRIAVILGVTAASSQRSRARTGVVQQGLGSSPGSVRPQTGVIQQGWVVHGFGTSPRSVRSVGPVAPRVAHGWHRPDYYR
jgi:hypothetical protein